MKKTCALLIAMIIGVFALHANPVTWSYKIVDDGTDHPSVQMTATIAPGYHLYNFDHKGMENPLSISIRPDGATLVGSPVPNKKATAEVDEDGMQARFFSNSVTFTQKLKPTKPNFSVTIKITGQACDDNSCSNINVAKKLTGKGKADTKDEAKADEEKAEDTKAEEVADTTAVAADEAVADATDGAAVAATGSINEDKLWRNVEKEVAQLSKDSEKEEEESSLWAIFLAGLLGGIIALITPCVWPMIPMTVSFFL